MKKILNSFILVFLGLLIGLNTQAQEYCIPNGTNTTGITIDSVGINGTILEPISNNLVDFLNDTVYIDSITPFWGLTTLNPMSPINTVFWRVSLDVNNDGVFGANEVFYDSGPVAPGYVTGTIDFSGLGFIYGNSWAMKIEMTSNPEYLGRCNEADIPPGVAYKALITRAIGDPPPKLTIINVKTGSDPTACPCIPYGSPIMIEMKHGPTSQNDVCVEFVEVFIQDNAGYRYDMNLFDIKIELYPGGTASTYNGPFYLRTSDKAVISLNTNSPDFSSGLKGNLFVEYNMYSLTSGSCGGSPLEDEIATLDYFGCPNPSSVVYDNHSSDPGVSEDLIPYLTTAPDITAHSNVRVETGDHCIFRAGEYIQLEPGFQVESGAEFWAHLAPLCIPEAEFDSDDSEQEAQLREEKPNEVNSFAAQENPFKVFPNPFKDNVNIELDLAKEEEVSILLFNTLGQVVATVLSPQKLQKGGHEFNFQMPPILPGLYYCQAKIGQQQYHQTLIKAE